MYMGSYRHYCTFRTWSSDFKVWLYLDHVLSDGEVIKLNTSSNTVYGDWRVSNCILVRTSSGIRTGNVYEATLERYNI